MSGSERAERRALLVGLLGVVDEATVHLEQLLGDLGLTVPLSQALRAIDPDSPPAMKDLADSLRCDRSSVTFLADRLTEHGLVTRIADPADRRSKVLKLTDKGREVRERMFDAMADASPLVNLDSKERQTVLALFSKALGSAQQPV